MNLFNHCSGTKNNNFYKKLVFGFFVAFVLTLLPAQNNLTFAQINPNIKTAIYKDVSPGVTGQLEISTETTSPDMGNISIKGFLKYDFPPQPQNISFTIKNIDGKNTFKDFTITSPASTANPIDVVFTNIPIDKTSKTTSIATKDRFLITSKTEKGVDFFFTGNNTYLGFNSFQEPAKTTTTTTTSSTSKPILTIEPGAPYTQSIVVTGSTLVSPKTTKKAATANVDFAVITLLPNNHTTPTYITFEKFVDTNTSETTTSEWAEIVDAINPRPDLYVLGASKHQLLVEQGKVYTIKTWASDSPTTKLGEGKYLGTFLINTDYLFGKKISNTAPGLAPVNQQTLDNVWSSITGTFNPGDIEFFKIGGTDGLVAGSKDAYIFLANIPGLANTTVTGTDGKPYPAFDPTIEGSFSKYITTFINIVYGLIALLTVLNIIYYGFQLMARSTVPFMKKENKDRITNSFIALLIALGSYLLLNTINPKLTNWGVGLVTVSVPGEGFGFISDGSAARLSEKYNPDDLKFSRTDYYNKLVTIGKQKGIPHCLMQVAIQRESRGKPYLIGHDEDVRSSAIKSRRDFIEQGKTQKGVAIVGSIKDLSAKNDDKGLGGVPPNMSAQDLGLDWRFSHSIGMFGITFFPKGSKYGDYSKGLEVPSLGKSVFPRDIYNPDTDIVIQAELMKAVYNKCGQDPLKTYRYWSSGNCNGSNTFTNKEAPLRKDLYDQCIAQDR